VRTKNTNSKKYYITTNSRKNIFSALHNCVNSKSAGANAVLVNICSIDTPSINAFSKEIHDKYPQALISREVLGKIPLGKIQPIHIFKDKEYDHKLYVVNFYCCLGKKTQNNNRIINYYALARCFHQLSVFIQDEINSTESNKTKIFLDKKSLAYTGCNWSFMDCIIEDVIPNIEIEIYDK